MLAETATVASSLFEDLQTARATVSYAVTQHWSVQVRAEACYGGLGAALVIGAVTGPYPAMRAAGLSPTEALRTV